MAAQAIIQAIIQALSTEQGARQAGEAALKQAEQTPQYSLMLLNVVQTAQTEMPIRQMAGVLFKNFIKYQWTPAEGQSSILNETDRQAIKTNIVTLMLSVPQQLQAQLQEALAIITEADFPAKWENLLPELISKLGQDTTINNGVLACTHAIFKRYRHQFRSDPLFAEMKYVIKLFAAPLLELVKAAAQAIEAGGGSAMPVEAITPLLTTILLGFKCFYSLNSQDLPEQFEDALAAWMALHHQFLVFEHPKLTEQGDDDRAGLLEDIRAAVCEDIALYSDKYDDEFKPYLAQFAQDVWELLVKVGKEEKYDLLVATSLSFLGAVARGPSHELFKEEQTLTTICEQIIIPCMMLRESDEELFEDNPFEYVKRDIEGSDIDTRRRTAYELVKSLTTHYEAEVTRIFSKYVTAMLGQYQAAPQENWRSKDASIYLVTALTVKSSTRAAGTTATNELVPVLDFFQNHILPDLQNSKQCPHPILLADAIKFVTTFRNQLPKATFSAVFPAVAQHLMNALTVVSTYAAAAVDRLLMVKDIPPAPTNPQAPRAKPTLRHSKDDLAPFLEAVLTALFSALQASAQNNVDNDYLMKAVMRVSSVAQERMAPYIAACIQGLVDQNLARVARNPSNPSFNHYLFEAISAQIKYVVPLDPSSHCTSFENALYPVFQNILQLDVVEFLQYVFQTMSLILRHRPTAGPMPAIYAQMLPTLLMPVLWDRQGNIPSMVQLLETYVAQCKEDVMKNNQLMAILGVFQKCVASKANDHHGFMLLDSLVRELPHETMKPYLKDLLGILFRRLETSRTNKFVRGLLGFMSLWVGKYGAADISATADAMQPGLFSMFVGQVWMPNMQKVSGTVERKTAAMGMIQLLCGSPNLFGDQALWASTVVALLKLFELPEEDWDDDEDLDVDLPFGEGEGMQSVSTPLNYARAATPDPFIAVGHIKHHFVKQLQLLSQQNPGKVEAVLKAALDGPAMALIQGYFTEAGIQLS